MPRTPNRADQHPAAPVDADEATIAQAWQQQLGQASTNPTLAARLRHASPALYGRFADAYRTLLALSRARRRKLLRGMGMTLAGAALAFALALGHVHTARAAGIRVGGSCTLINAITAANTDSATGGCAAGKGADIITLPAHATITLTSVNNSSYGPSGLPVITSAITIAGNAATIARDTSAADFIIMPVGSRGILTLSNTTITGGSGSAGGGILNHGIATLNNSTVSGNTTVRGGGIFNYGTLTLNNSTVSGNTAINHGGGIFNYGTLTLNNSTVSGNTAINDDGGGIVNNYGTLTLSNSTVSGNTAGGHSGGIDEIYGTATLSNSTVSGNTALRAGGIFNYYGTMTLSNSTVSGNIASFSGGGIFNDRGMLTLSNSTVSGNTAGGAGGGIYNNTLYYDDQNVDDIGSTRLERSLISGNRAAGHGNELYNVRIAGHTYTSTSTLYSANYNLFGHSGESKSQAVANFTPSGSDITAASDGTRPTALAAILDTTLQNNGGNTKTHALVRGSPAVDAVPSGPATDQRGITRPQGAHLDIGAFELDSTDLTNRCTTDGGVLICEMLPAIWSR